MHRLLIIGLLVFSMIGCTQDTAKNSSPPDESTDAKPTWTPNEPTPVDEDD